MTNKIYFFILLLFPVFIHAQKKISADVEIKKVYKGKVITIKKEVYYQSNGKMIIHFSSPEEYYMITNVLGEAKIYIPSRNEVMLINDAFLSSEGELMYYFMANKIEDLGLKNLGFSLFKTETSGKNIIRTYIPNNPKSGYSKIELVHENYLPIYCAYYDTKNKITQKIYYSNYQKLSSIILPTRITEIAYMSGNDSTINRMIYSNIKSDKNATSSNFDFEIPKNAKVVSKEALPH